MMTLLHNIRLKMLFFLIELVVLKRTVLIKREEIEESIKPWRVSRSSWAEERPGCWAGHRPVRW